MVKKDIIEYILVATAILIMLLPTTNAAHIQPQTPTGNNDEGLVLLEIIGQIREVRFDVGIENGTNTTAHGTVTLFPFIPDGTKTNFTIDFTVLTDSVNEQFISIPFININYIVCRMTAELHVDGYEQNLTAKGFKIGPFILMKAIWNP